MSYFKVVFILWVCINVESLKPAFGRGSTNPFNIQQHFCAELLERAIEIYCIENSNIPVRDESAKASRPGSTALLDRWKPNPTRNSTLERNRKSTVRKLKYTFLQNECCTKTCSLNYIKANCPGTRNRSKTPKKFKTTSDTNLKTVINSTTARTTTTAKTTTTTTTTSTTSTTTTSTTSTTTPSYEDDYWLYILPSS